ncbi:histidine triad nucleotide-binding protein [Nocardioides sp. JQ2195]|uniref:histidine triad nucleotide-binding protein n=1 Tax=Nocardioides sp. JQ2195 TaxID=2592334 RepID=UPI00143E37B9|nr:histidine triad nucleotide-binding protein [Nocardioides sp. JQ2195]QIX27353.1 histidine triad nucleotide-binding protein [Nocardioides sp. JQ2195]
MTTPVPPDDCIFCKIVAGDLPAEVVHASDSSVAFKDLNPQAPTHFLVIPRSHYANAAELAVHEPSALADLFTTARDVAEEKGLEGYRAVFNTGAAAQQTVFHAHLHVLAGRELTWPPG